MPAKCGSSPRANVGIILSVSESEPGRPMSSAHCCSRRQPLPESLSSASIAFHPCVLAGVEVGVVAALADRRGDGAGLPRCVPAFSHWIAPLLLSLFFAAPNNTGTGESGSRSKS